MSAYPALGFTLFIGLTTATAYAEEIDLSPYVEKKQFILAGTINPPSISLNGQQLNAPNGAFKNLYVNSKLVPITVTENLKSFYHSVESDSISLDWEKLNGEKTNFLNLQFPSLTRVTTNGYQLQWNFSESVTKAKLDAEDISLEKPVTPMQNIKKWVKNPHVLELSSPNNMSQIYQLDFSSYQRELFRRYSASYSLGEPSFNAFWESVSSGFSAAIHYEDDRYLDINYYYSEKDRTFDSGSTTRPINQKLYELKSRYGYQLFNSNWNDFDLFRLTFGFQGQISRYLRTSTITDSFDGYTSDKVDSSYAVVGAFSRWEPLQYKNFGVSVTIDFPLYATLGTSRISTAAYFSLNYYFKSN